MEQDGARHRAGLHTHQGGVLIWLDTIFGWAYKTRIQFIGEKFLKAEIPLDLYKSIENNFAERLAAEEENQFMIDVKWANEFLKK